jgi:hypothetical protein
VFTRCLFCHTPFAANETLEYFPRARRIAFDGARGRLWAICNSCHRWNLTPIEDRWEALEELEKTTRDNSRLLSQTDNISLLKSGELEIVRVGQAKLTEEAWWRYGREMLRRRKLSYVLQGVEVAAMIGLAFVTGGGAFNWGVYNGSNGVITSLIKLRKFGFNAWQGEAACTQCGSVITKLRFSRAGKARIVPSGQDIAIRVACANCGHERNERRRHLPISEPDEGHRIEGMAAEHVLRRVLAHKHFNGASEKRVREATDLIEQVGSAAALTRTLARDRPRLKDVGGKKDRTRSIALEIAVNDDNERKMLELEVAQIEERWREEEEIAAIVDGELTAVPSLPKSLKS